MEEYKQHILLAEEIHPVLQGEGNFVGRKMLVCRVAGCNLKCKSCDSKHSWKINPKLKYNITEFTMELYKHINKHKTNSIMITGGAPSLYKDVLKTIIDENPNLAFYIEDAGDNSWSDYRGFTNVFFSFSPKIGVLKTAQDITTWEGLIDPPHRYICKIVVSSNNIDKQIKVIEKFQKEYNIPNNRIYLMPFGITGDEIRKHSKIIINKCFEHNYNFSPRLHILLFDNEKMV